MENKNIWRYGLVPFEDNDNDEDKDKIDTAGKALQENENIDWSRSVEFQKQFEPDVILATYSDTKAWTPFASCGCEPRDLYKILQCNALVCALATFLYLDKRNDRAVSALVHQKEILHPGMIESIWSEISKRYDRNKKQDYLENCLLHIIKETKAPGSKRTIQANPVLAPIIEAVLLKKVDEHSKIDKHFRTLMTVYNTYAYAPEGRSVRTGHSEAEKPSSISASTERKRQNRLCIAYERFYKEWMELSPPLQKNEHIGDTYASEFLQELVFHHRALSRSEQELKVVFGEYQSKIKLDIDGEVDDIAQTLYCLCRIPLVFGADKLKFRRRKTEYAFGQYFNFIKLTTVRFYERAGRDLEKACDMIRGLLDDKKFESLIKTNEETMDHCVHNLTDKFLVKIAVAAVKGLSEPDYYGKNSIAYAPSPDEYFSIVTETSREKKNPVRTVRKNGKLKIEVDPDKVEPDISVVIARFGSKEKRDAFLSDLDATGHIISNAINAISGQVIPIALEAKDDEAH